jgi:hypothetical protein
MNRMITFYHKRNIFTKVKGVQDFKSFVAKANPTFKGFETGLYFPSVAFYDEAKYEEFINSKPFRTLVANEQILSDLDMDSFDNYVAVLEQDYRDDDCGESLSDFTARIDSDRINYAHNPHDWSEELEEYSDISDF